MQSLKPILDARKCLKLWILFDSGVNCAKVAEQIEMVFAIETTLNQGYTIRGDLSAHRKGTFTVVLPEHSVFWIFHYCADVSNSDVTIEVFGDVEHLTIFTPLYCCFSWDAPCA